MLMTVYKPVTLRSLYQSNVAHCANPATCPLPSVSESVSPKAMGASCHPKISTGSALEEVYLGNLFRSNFLSWQLLLSFSLEKKNQPTNNKEPGLRFVALTSLGHSWKITINPADSWHVAPTMHLALCLVLLRWVTLQPSLRIMEPFHFEIWCPYPSSWGLTEQFGVFYILFVCRTPTETVPLF